MRKYLAAAAAVFLVAGSNAVSAQTANDRVEQSFGSGYVKASAVILKRSDPNDSVIISSNPGTTSYVSGDDFDFEFAPGFDGTIGLYITPNNAIEVRTLQFGTSADLSTTTPGNFIGTGFTGPSGILIEGEYDTDLESWEANWRYEFNDRIAILAGPRFIKLDDTAAFNITTVARGLYDYQNELLGAQIGAEVSVLPTESPFSIDLSGKIGYYRLEAEGGNTGFLPPTTPVNFFGTETEDETFAGELGIDLGYRPTENITLHAGYQALFIADVALASDNAGFSRTNPSLLNTNIVRDDIVFHGATFGISVVW